jgi:O-antigen/teichoic acid export membrane protein
MVNEEDLSTHLAARGMLHLASKDFVSSISAIVFFVVIARLLPNVNDLGVLVGLQTLSLMFVLVSGIGLPYAATRFVSAYVGSDQVARANRLYPILFTHGIILSAVFSTALFIFSPQVSEILFHDAKLTVLVQLISLDIFFLTIGTFCMSLLDASMEFKKIARVSIAITLIKYSLALLFFMIGLGLTGIILGLVIADAFGVFAFTYALSTRIFRTKTNLSSFVVEVRPILKFALSLYGYILCSFLLFRTDVYLLMILSTLYMVGLYGPAVFVSVTFFILLASIDQGLLPFTSRIYGKYGTTHFKHLAARVSRFLLLFYFPLGFAIAASSPTLVTMIMGERYVDSIYPTFIIVIAIILLSPGILANNLLRSAGYTSIALKATSAALVFQVLISLILIPEYGIVGAAMSRFFAVFVMVVPLIYALHKIGGLDFDRRALAYGLIGSGAITIEIIMIGSFFVGPFSLLPQYAIAFFSYLLILKLSRSLDQKDVELLDRVFMGKINWLIVPLAKLVVREN